MGRSAERLLLRITLAVSLLAVTAGACGGGGDSLAEYAETLKELASEMSAELEAGDNRFATAPTIETAREVITGGVDTRSRFQAALVALDSPDELAVLHVDLVDVHARIISAQEAFAGRAGLAATLEELEQSAEAQAYRAMNVEGESFCHEFQARIDATADRGSFGVGPWVPGEDLKEVAEVTLGC